MNRTVREIRLDGKLSRIRVILESDDCAPYPDLTSRWQLAHLLRSVADNPSLLNCDGELQLITVRHGGSRWALEAEFLVDEEARKL